MLMLAVGRVYSDPQGLQEYLRLNPS
jgi:hypothetical protein